MGNSIGGFFEEIIDRARGEARIHADSVAPQATIRDLLERDYASSLRRSISYQHVQSLLSDFKTIFPDFNQRPTGKLSTAQFAEIARTLGFYIRATPFEGEDGLALLGFYIPSTPNGLARPLIYVNTAHIPVVVMTSFMHELAHHRSRSLFGTELQSMHLLDFNYAEHLDEPAELAADIAVSLAGYPEAVARKIFTNTRDRDSGTSEREWPASVVEDIYRHLGQAYELDLTAEMPNESRLQYLAGMIHFAKLRAALLAEFDL